jgi:hypothetical protein
MDYEEYKQELFKLNGRVQATPPSAIFGELVLGLLTEIEEVLVYAPGTESLAHEVGDACAYIALIEDCMERWGFGVPYFAGAECNISGLTKAAHRILRGDKKKDWAGDFQHTLQGVKLYLLNTVEPFSSEEEVYALNIVKLKKRINQLGTFAKD